MEKEHQELSWKNILNVFDVTARRQGKDVGQDEDCNEDCKSVEDCKDEVLHEQLAKSARVLETARMKYCMNSSAKFL